MSPGFSIPAGSSVSGAASGSKPPVYSLDPVAPPGTLPRRNGRKDLAKEKATEAAAPIAERTE